MLSFFTEVLSKDYLFKRKGRLKMKTDEKKEFKPMIEVFDPFKVPFSEKKELKFSLRELDACTACTACTACK